MRSYPCLELTFSWWHVLCLLLTRFGIATATHVDSMPFYLRSLHLCLLESADCIVWCACSARHGFEWWQFDVTWQCVRLLKALGLASNVKLPSEKQKQRMAIA